MTAETESHADRIEREWRSRPPAERVAGAIAILRRRAQVASEGITAGPWLAEWDSCDCNDGMCSHGSWICSVSFQQAQIEPVHGTEVSDYHRRCDTEITSEAMVWMLTLQPAAGLALVALLEASGDRPEVVTLADAILAEPSPGQWSFGNALEAGLALDPYEYDYLHQHSCGNCEGVDPATCLSNPALAGQESPA